MNYDSYKTEVNRKLQITSFYNIWTLDWTGLTMFDEQINKSTKINTTHNFLL